MGYKGGEESVNTPQVVSSSQKAGASAGGHVVALEAEVRRIDSEKLALVRENGELRKLLKALRVEMKKTPSHALPPVLPPALTPEAPTTAHHHDPIRLFDLPLDGEGLEVRALRLAEQNRQLSMRCTELLIDVTEKNEAVAYLRQRVSDAASGHSEKVVHEAPAAAAKEYHLMQEVAHLREEVMSQATCLQTSSLYSPTPRPFP